MSPPEPDEIAALLAAARAARDRAYVPYSRFPVGAAVLTGDREIVAGANVENAAYPLSLCAERIAVGSAVTRGAKDIVAVAVVGSKDRFLWPCGACRQVLHEFGPDLLVISEAPDGSREERRLPTLLPEAFGPSDLP